MDRIRRDPNRRQAWRGQGRRQARPEDRARVSAAARRLRRLLRILSRVLLSARPYVGVHRGILAALAIAITIASVWFCYAAARALGRQWALMARVIEGHELISQGPYAVVRNPIYLAMLGMLIAIGLCVSRWQALVGAVVCSRLAPRFASARRKICCARPSARNLKITRGACLPSCPAYGHRST